MILAQALAPKDVEAATPASAPSLQIALVVPDIDLPSASANFSFFYCSTPLPISVMCYD